MGSQREGKNRLLADPRQAGGNPAAEDEGRAAPEDVDALCSQVRDDLATLVSRNVPHSPRLTDSSGLRVDFT